MNEDDVEVDDAAASDDDVDETGAGLQNASDGQVQTILKLAMMAGSKKKEAVELIKNLVGISEVQEKYVFDELARMARTPKPRNPYKGRPRGQTNREGHNAGRPSNSSKRDVVTAAAAMFGQRTVRQRTDCSSSAAANEQQQAAETAQATAAAKAAKSAEEKKRHDRAIEKIEHYVASIPNGSFTATILEVDDDDEGLDLDVDSVTRAERTKRTARLRNEKGVAKTEVEFGHSQLP